MSQESELPVDPDAEENLDEIDHKAAAEGDALNRKFSSTRGLDTFERLADKADRFGKTKGRTEKKHYSTPETADDRLDRLKAMRRERSKK